MALQNPNNYTKAGAESSVITTDTTTVTVTAAKNGDEAYIYYDFGDNSIVDFTLKLTLNVSASIGAIWGGFCAAVADSVGSWVTQYQSSDDGYGLEFENSSDYYLQLHDFVDQTDGAASTGLTKGTDYYVTFSRTGTSLTYTCRTTSHTGTVVDTDTITVDTTARRYLQLYFTRDGGFSPSNTHTATMADIDFVYSGPPPSSSFFIEQNHYRIGVRES